MNNIKRIITLLPDLSSKGCFGEQSSFIYMSVTWDILQQDANNSYLGEYLLLAVFTNIAILAWQTQLHKLLSVLEGLE